jgi:hypothetical protein
MFVHFAEADADWWRTMLFSAEERSTRDILLGAVQLSRHARHEGKCPSRLEVPFEFTS